jgi:DNA repair protein RadD
MSITHRLRPYQADLVADIYRGWAEGDTNVLAVLATGGGKTLVVAAVVSETKGPVCVMAHRGELVTQISTALAREGVRHRIIGSSQTARACSAEHMAQLGQDFISPTSRVAVASVDTLIRANPNDPWFASVVLWVVDEAHHCAITGGLTAWLQRPELVSKANKWARATRMFPNARGLGVTATPMRADGQGLGAHADGVFHRMVCGPNMRWLILNGFLTHYRVIGKPSNIDLSQVTIAADGDYSKPKLSVARAKSTITGDIVKHYLSFAAGKQGITFDCDVAAATATAAAYRQWGISAEVVHGDTPDELRRSIIARYRRRELLQMVNVDLFGEGFDVPRCSVASMGRPTQSYPLFKQQFGRPLRPDPDDPDKIAIIIDHVGNVDPVHGLPDTYREESLDRRERRSSSGPSDAIPTTTCTNKTCAATYERYHKRCPYCGTVREIANRGGPEFVDGDLTEIDPAVLARMRGEQERIDGPAYMPANVDGPTRSVIMRRHAERQTAQNALRRSISLWSGWMNRDDTTELHVHYRKFYYRYGLDVQSAQTLGTQDAVSLKAKIDADLAKHGVST